MLAMIASLAWIASDMGKTQPREARRLSLVLTIAAAFLTWFSFTDFFAAPMLMSAIALVVLIAATVALGREAADLSEREVSR